MSTAEKESPNWQGAEYSSAVSLGEFVRTLKRNAGVFWTTLIACLALGALASLLIPKAYAASAEVLVEGASPNGISPTPENIVGELTVPGSSYPLTTQVELLQSQEIYFRALIEAGIRQPKDLEEYQTYPKVFVRQKAESNIFIVTVEGRNKEQAIRIAQAYPIVFQNFSQQMKAEAVTRGITFVKNRLDQEREAIKVAEEEFANFKTSNNVSDTQAELQLRLGLVSSTENALYEAQSTASAAQASVDVLRSQLANIPATREQFNDQQSITYLANARTELTNLKQRRALFSETYLDSSPQIKEIDNQIKLQEARIKELDKELPAKVKEINPEYDAVKRRLAEASAEAAAAQSRVAQLQGVASARQARLNELAGVAKQQRDLERRISLHQASLEQFQKISDELGLRENDIKSQVTNLTPGVFAEQSRPNWMLNMALASILGLALAVVFSMVRDSVQDKVNTKEEAFALSQLSPLAHIPERPRSKHPLITNPQTNLAFEAYRVLRSTITTHAKGSPMKSLVVTSTLRKEGKSVVAANLAVAYVLSGQRTILVDANLRHPGVHNLFGCKDNPGLGDVLLGTHTIEDALQPTSVDGLYVMSAGTIPANATEAIGSPRMREIVELLQGKADMVVFDAPQVAGLADAPSIASVTDAAILVTDIGVPSKAEFKEAVGLMETSSPSLLGMVENRVSAKEAHLTKA